MAGSMPLRIDAEGQIVWAVVPSIALGLPGQHVNNFQVDDVRHTRETPEKVTCVVPSWRHKITVCVQSKARLWIY